MPSSADTEAESALDDHEGLDALDDRQGLDTLDDREGRDAERTTRQQKDNLCGPFHAARILRDAGVRQWESEPLDQDLVAVRAGTTLPRHEDEPPVPPGADSWRDYRHQLGSSSPASSGTSAGSLAEAIEALSGGRLVCVPLSGTWSGETVQRLVQDGRRAGARLVANLRTGRLWGSRPPVELLLARLEGRDLADPPPADWDVGHFVELVQLVQGSGGALVVVRDSYPNLGWAGHHLQPPEALAAALMRGDGRRGGVLAVVPASDAATVRALARELGLEIELWNNRR
jgi:hypothetical protein